VLTRCLPRCNPMGRPPPGVCVSSTVLKHHSHLKISVFPRMACVTVKPAPGSRSQAASLPDLLRICRRQEIQRRQDGTAVPRQAAAAAGRQKGRQLIHDPVPRPETLNPSLWESRGASGPRLSHPAGRRDALTLPQLWLLQMASSASLVCVPDTSAETPGGAAGSPAQLAQGRKLRPAGPHAAPPC